VKNKRSASEPLNFSYSSFPKAHVPSSLREGKQGLPYGEGEQVGEARAKPNKIKAKNKHS
jgi:hypothetical protein